MTEVFKQFVLSNDFINLGQSKNLCSVEKKEPEPKEFFELKEKINQAYEMGFKKGREEALKQGKEQAYAEYVAQAKFLKQLIASVSESLSKSRLSLTEEIAGIVLAICQKFFIHQQQNKETITHQIRAVLNEINNKQALILFLNPNDLASLQQGKLKIDLNLCQNIKIVADKKLALGGCLIHSEHGVFDASIERQIDRLKELLLSIKVGTSSTPHFLESKENNHG